MLSIVQSSLMGAGVTRRSNPGRTHSSGEHWKEADGDAYAEAFLRWLAAMIFSCRHSSFSRRPSARQPVLGAPFQLCRCNACVRSLYSASLAARGFCVPAQIPHKGSDVGCGTLRTTWSVQRSWACIIIASMLIRPAQSRTSRSITPSCHLMPMDDLSGLVWKRLSCLTWFLYRVHVSQL